MNIKKIWKNIVEALPFHFVGFGGMGEYNLMNTQAVQSIQEKVFSQTGFNVACMDARFVGGRKNVGLVMPKNTPEAEVKKAEDIFMAAARNSGFEIKREDIPHYVPGTEPRPSRLVLPTPEVW